MLIKRVLLDLFFVALLPLGEFPKVLCYDGSPRVDDAIGDEGVLDFDVVFNLLLVMPKVSGVVEAWIRLSVIMRVGWLLHPILDPPNHLHILAVNLLLYPLLPLHV